MNSKTFYQAVLFGVVSVLLGLLFSMVFGFMKPELPEECKTWNQYYVMEISLFCVGFTLRMILTNDQAVSYLHQD